MARATPNDPYPDRTKMVQIVDMEKHDYQPFGMKEAEYGELCFFKLPMDFPGFMRILRRVDMERQGKSSTSHHLATTLEITMGDGRRVWLKWDRIKDRLTISTQAEDEDNVTQLGRY